MIKFWHANGTETEVEATIVGGTYETIELTITSAVQNSGTALLYFGDAEYSIALDSTIQTTAILTATKIYDDLIAQGISGLWNITLNNATITLVAKSYGDRANALIHNYYTITQQQIITWTITSAPDHTQNNVKVYVRESAAPPLTHSLNFDHTTLTTANLTAEYIRSSLTFLFDGAGSDWSVSGSDNEVIFTNNSDVQLDAPAFDDDDFNDYSKAFVEIEITDISSVSTATDFGVGITIDGGIYYFEDVIQSNYSEEDIATTLASSTIWLGLDANANDTIFASRYDISSDVALLTIEKKGDGEIVLPTTLSFITQSAEYHQTQFTFNRAFSSVPSSHTLTFSIYPDNIVASIDCFEIYHYDYNANNTTRFIAEALGYISDVYNNFTISYTNNTLTLTAKNYGAKEIWISATPVYITSQRIVIAGGAIEIIPPDFEYAITDHQYGEITTPLFTMTSAEVQPFAILNVNIFDYDIEITEGEIEYDESGVYYGIEYPTIAGAILIDNLNETLDSATIFLPPMSDINIQPFDIVEITGDNIERRMYLVDNFIKKQVSFNPAKYEYTINTMSKTKGLERIVLPAVSYTKRALSLKVYDALLQLLDDYCPKALFNFAGLTTTYEPIYQFDFGDYETTLKNTNVPEIQLNDKTTLREAIDTLLATIGCICSVDRDNYITIVDLSKKGSAIDTSNLSFIEETQSAQDTANELEITIKNASQSSISGVDSRVRAIDYVGWRNSDEALLTTNNVRIETQKPIYELLSLKICGMVVGKVQQIGTEVQYNGSIYAEIDIINGTYTWTDSVSGQTLSQTISHCVEEKSIYETLPIDTKKRCVFWERGKNTIEGWSKVYDTSAIWDKNVATNMFEYISGGTNGNSMLGRKYGTIAFDNHPESPSRGDSLLPTSVYKHTVDKSLHLDNWYFKVEYLTEDDVKMSVGKHLPTNIIHNTLVDNQTQPFVDVRLQAKVEADKINRLGNLTKTIYGEYTSEDDIPTLGDYLGDYTLIRRELSVHDNIISFKGIMSENYVNINYLTSINARRRSWQVVDASQAFKKDLLRKHYCEFSFEAKNNYPIDEYNFFTSGESRGFARTLLFRLINAWSVAPSALPIKYAIVSLPSNDAFALDVVKLITDKSIIFTFGFLDNTIVSNYIAQTNFATGGHLQDFYKYTVGNDATQSSYFIQLARKLSSGDNDFTWATDGAVINTSQSNAQNAKSRIKPLVNYVNPSDIVFRNPFYNHKDNREIINFNYQFEFCADTPNIVFAPLFIEQQHMVANTNAFYNQVKVFASTTHIYKQGDTIKQGSEVSGITIAVSDGNDSSKISTSGWNNSDYLSFRSYAICDNSGRLLVAVNKRVGVNEHRDFYLNVRRSRDSKTFTASSMASWVNEIPSTPVPRYEEVYFEFTSGYTENSIFNDILQFVIGGNEYQVNLFGRFSMNTYNLAVYVSGVLSALALSNWTITQTVRNGRDTIKCVAKTCGAKGMSSFNGEYGADTGVRAIVSVIKGIS